MTTSPPLSAVRSVGEAQFVTYGILDAILIRASGELDYATAPTLGELGSQAIATGHGLRIDLSDAQFMDAFALGVLVALRREALSSGLGFEVVAAHPRVQRVMMLSGLSVMFAHPA